MSRNDVGIYASHAAAMRMACVAAQQLGGHWCVHQAGHLWTVARVGE